MAQFRGSDVERAKALDARRVDDVTASGQVVHFAERGGVKSRIVGLADFLGADVKPRDEPVEERALPHPAVAAQQRGLAGQHAANLVHPLALHHGGSHAVIAETEIEIHQLTNLAQFRLAVEVCLVENEGNWNAIGLSRGQVAVDENDMGLRVGYGDKQKHQVYVRGQDVALLRKVRGLADNIVPAVQNVRYQPHALLVRGLHLHPVAHSHRVGVANATQAKVALHLARKRRAIVRADDVPASGVLYDGASHLIPNPNHRLHGHDFLLLGRKEVVYLLDVLVVKFLQLFLGILLGILGQSVLDTLLQFVDDFATAVAHAHLGLLALLSALLGQLPAALLGERRNVDADDFTVILGHDAKVAVDDGLLDDLEHRLVPRLDGYGAGVWRRHGGTVVDGHHGAIVVDANTID